ncbi:MAG TPA: universal stress protein [Burkholderiaceae bacterium]|nr:universal stress protein [Burkholderiaceae bacterium]
MYQRILVPIDGSAPAKLALDEAIKLARSTKGRVLLLHVAQIPVGLDFGAGMAAGSDVVFQALAEAGKDALKNAQQAAEAAGVPVETRLAGPEIGAIAPSIVEAAEDWKADLLVMGTHGRRGLDHLMLGSVAERVLRTTPVPVLMVRPTKE